jgi:hypothetical protein
MAKRVAVGAEKIASSEGMPVEIIRWAEGILLRHNLIRRLVPVGLAAAATVLAIFVVFQAGSFLKEKPSAPPESGVLTVVESKPAEGGDKGATDRMAGVQNVPENLATLPRREEENNKKEDHLAAAPSKAWAAGPPPPPAEPAAALGKLARAPAGPQQAKPQLPEQVAQAQSQLQVQAAPKEQKLAQQEAAPLAERIPPLVAKQLAQEGRGEAEGGAPRARAAERGGEAEGRALRAKSAKGKSEMARAATAEAEPITAPALADKNIGVQVKPLAGEALKEEKFGAPEVAAPVLGSPLSGKVEQRTLILRANNVPAASAEVKEMLVRLGSQVSKDYYASGSIDGAGARINARVAAARYPTLLEELRQKNYLVSEPQKPAAKAAKTKAEAPTQTAADVIDLTIRFQTH